MTARETFRHAADLIAAHLQPEARAFATATTFREIGDIGGDLPLTPADLAAGLELVAQPRGTDEPPPVSARRTTCREIAELLRQSGATEGDPQRLAVVLLQVDACCGGSVAARYRAIAATAAREAAEIMSTAGAGQAVSP